MKSPDTKTMLWIVLSYVVFAGLWIFLSDRALERLPLDPAAHTLWSLGNGWLFVLVTALLLAGLLRVQFRARSRNKHALQESEARMRALGDNLPESYVYQYVHDADGKPRFIYLSAGVERLHGIKVETVLRDAGALHAQIAPEQMPALTAAESESLRQMTDFHMELRMRRADGQWRWLQVRSRPRRKPDGSIIWDGVATDITARKEFEKALRRERDFSDAILDCLPGVFYCYDENLNFRRWNRNFERVTGYRDEEIARMSPLDFFSGAGKALLAARIRQVFDQGESSVEADFVRKDGTHTPYYFTGLAAKIEGRRHLVGVGVDIAQRKQAEAALRESHERLKKVLEVETVGVTFWDLTTGRMTDANDAFLKVMGYSRREVEAGELTWQKLTPPEYTEASLAEIRKFQATGRVGPYEKEYLHKDGTRQWFLFAGSALGHSACVEFCVDISSRKRSEAALRASEERLRLATDAARMGTFDWDLRLNRIVWSHWHEELWGFKAGEFGGTYEAFAARVQSDDLPDINAEVRRCIANRTHFHREFRVVWPDASVHWILGTGEFTFDPAGQAVRMLGVVKEITERKLAESELRHSREQLRALSARLETLREEERTRISREIHDELGQMLTSIKMDLRWIEHRLDDFGDDRRVNPILDKLVATAELTDATVKTVQRIAAELRPGILDKLGLGMALQYEAAQFEARTGIACRVLVPDTEPALAPHTATAFFRIFQEALTNVARHAHAATVEVDLRPEADALCLEIRDDGRGLTGVDLANPKSLGLLGMQERARLLGGEVVFTRRPEGGTIVAVRMPHPATGQTGI